MNEIDVVFAIIDVLMFGKLEIEVLGGGDDTCYYASIRNDHGLILVDATERRVGDAIVVVRDRIIAHYKGRNVQGELI